MSMIMIINISAHQYYISIVYYYSIIYTYLPVYLLSSPFTPLGYLCFHVKQKKIVVKERVFESSLIYEQALPNGSS